MEFDAPLPEYFVDILQKLGKIYNFFGKVLYISPKLIYNSSIDSVTAYG